MIYVKCCTLGTRGKTQIAQKNVAHWGQCCTLGGCTLGASGVVQLTGFSVFKYTNQGCFCIIQPKSSVVISAKAINLAINLSWPLIYPIKILRMEKS